MIRRKRVYLAGPKVFAQNAEAIGHQLKLLCSMQSLDALWPLDNAIAGDTLQRKAERIFAGNVEMIRSCDAVVADLTPFRGPHMDCGTAWKCGFAHALGKQVFAWSDNGFTLIDRMGSPQWRDADGMLIENFELSDNLMIAVPAGFIHATPALAIKAAAEALRR
jgi:nucleoside 2-deoxyribosyltransferase